MAFPVYQTFGHTSRDRPIEIQDHWGGVLELLIINFVENLGLSWMFPSASIPITSYANA